MSTEDKETKPASHTPSSDFAKEVAEVEGGEAINKCVQCGICTASCVVARATDTYRPRHFIQKIILGMRDEVLTSEDSWYCMACRMCEERCQEGVSPAEIFHAVRVVAAREGHIPNVFKQTVKTVLEDGWLLEDSYSDFTEDEREDLGLKTDLKMNKEFGERVRKKYFKGDEEEAKK
jgi:heterodisulfide reductase subunit C